MKLITTKQWNEESLYEFINSYNDLVIQLELIFDEYVFEINEIKYAKDPRYYKHVDSYDYEFKGFDLDVLPVNALFSNTNNSYDDEYDADISDMPVSILYDDTLDKLREKVKQAKVDGQAALIAEKKRKAEEAQKAVEAKQRSIEQTERIEYERLRVKFEHIPWPDGKGNIR